MGWWFQREGRAKRMLSVRERERERETYAQGFVERENERKPLGFLQI